MILLVDDNKNVLHALRLALERQGLDVRTASDGMEAYAAVQQPDCACMVLDINMPRFNGVELLLLMQAEAISVPTVVMAGFEDFNEPEMKQFANVVQFLPKPFDMAAMVQAVRHCTARPVRKQ